MTALEEYFKLYNAWVRAEFGGDQPEVQPFVPTPTHNRVDYIYSSINIDVGDGEEELPIGVYADLYNLRLMAEFVMDDDRFEPVIIQQFSTLEELVDEIRENANMTDCGDTAWDGYYYEGARALRAKYEKEEIA